MSVSFAQGSVMMALHQRNTDYLVQALHDVSDPSSPHYGHYWTQEMIDDLVNPPQDEVDLFLRHLGDSGMNCVQRGAAVECDQMPCLNGFSNLIEFIEVARSVYKPRHNVGVGDGYVAREVVLQLYNITRPTVQNKGVSLCAVEYQYGEGFNAGDLKAVQQLNNEQPVTIAVDHIVGSNGGPDVETQLDVQMMATVAENVELWYWHEDSWLYSFGVHFLNASKVPDVLSISWGWSEAQQCNPGLGPCPNITSAQYVHRTNLEYVKMGLRGVTINVASGDAGAPGRTNELCLNPGTYPVFPGSSPYVTSVGATYVVPSQAHKLNRWGSPLCVQYGCVNGTVELPTNFADTGWTTGGGFAVYDETRPTWQNAAVAGYLKSDAKRPSNFSKNGRGYPDVSVVGHNCPVMDGGSLMPVDGTSCSSPLFAAMVALMNDFQVGRGKPKLGFLNPLLYKMWEDDPTLFKDITQGNNWCTEENCCTSDFGFEATKGWDPVTGLGTPNFGRILEWLERNT